MPVLRVLTNRGGVEPISATTVRTCWPNMAVALCSCTQVVRLSSSNHVASLIIFLSLQLANHSWVVICLQCAGQVCRFRHAFVTTQGAEDHGISTTRPAHGGSGPTWQPLTFSVLWCAHRHHFALGPLCDYVILLQEKGPADLSGNWPSGHHQVGPGTLPLTCLDRCVCLHLQGNQKLRKGENNIRYGSLGSLVKHKPKP